MDDLNSCWPINPMSRTGLRPVGYLFSLSGHNVSELSNDAGYVTGTYSPANPGRWTGTPPVTLVEAMNRLAVAVSGNGANPIV